MQRSEEDEMKSLLDGFGTKKKPARRKT
jgi:hypothetical protein